MAEKIKIVIADDELELCTILKNILEKTAKFDVFFSTTGRGALELAKEKVPGLILLDVRMPDMDGLEVAKRLSLEDSTQNIPVVFLTAVAIPLIFLTNLVGDEDLRGQAHNHGGYYFIQKPITSSELLSRIDSILTEFNKNLTPPG